MATRNRVVRWALTGAMAARDSPCVCGQAPGHAGVLPVRPEPQTWGLRGDPYLWRALRAHLAAEDIPASPGELDRVLHEAFRELAGTTSPATPPPQQ